MFISNSDIGNASSFDILLVHILIFVDNMLIEFLNEGIRVAEWIKMPPKYPGDTVIDNNLKRLKAVGRSKYFAN